MYKIKIFFFTIIWFLLFINSTKQSHVRQAITTFKAIGKTIEKPIIKAFSNTIKNSMSTFHQNKKTIKTLASGLQQNYFSTKHNFGSKPQLPLLFVTGGLNKLTQFNLLPPDDGIDLKEPMDIEKVNQHKDKNHEKQREYYQKYKDKIAVKKIEYYKNNKEKILAHQKQYNLKNKEQISIKSKKYRENNKDRILAIQKKYNQKNKEQISEKRKVVYIENRDAILAKTKEYYLKNKDKIAEKRKLYIKSQQKNIENIKK